MQKEHKRNKQAKKGKKKREVWDEEMNLDNQGSLEQTEKKERKGNCQVLSSFL